MPHDRTALRRTRAEGALLGAALALAVGVSAPGHACMWGEDVEALALRAAEDLDTMSPAKARFMAAAAVPSGGYALAVVGRSMALPYSAVAGRGPTAVADIATLGFTAVVHLGTSETVGLAPALRRVDLGTASEVPEAAAIALFTQLVERPESLPLIIHAPRPEPLAKLWALHLVASGVPAGQAMALARAIGLDRQSEATLWWHLRNGRLKGLAAGGPQNAGQ